MTLAVLLNFVDAVMATGAEQPRRFGDDPLFGRFLLHGPAFSPVAAVATWKRLVRWSLVFF